MATYKRAGKDVLDMVQATMAKYHGPKADAGVEVLVLMASPNCDENGDPMGPAVSVNGYPCAGKIKVLSLKDRVATGCDAEMQLDSDVWDESSDEERAALVDHELTHLELRVDDKGNVKRDDIDRPKLRCRKHDAQHGWFFDVAQRHGEASFEVREARALLGSESWSQCFLPGLEPVEV